MLVIVPVYERVELLRHCLASAAELELPPGAEVLLLDDASPTLDLPALVAEAGLTCTIERQPARRGADAMVKHILRRFLASGHDHMLCLDSDMVANRDAVTVALRLVSRFDGLLSLYNSIWHVGTPFDADLVAKPTVGNAGTFWSRRLAEIALSEITEHTEGVDFAYCATFRRRGIPIAATTQSRLQHLGIVGTHNASFGQLEHGLGFVPDSLAQWRAIGFVYDELMSRQPAYLPPPRPPLPERLGNWAARRARRLVFLAGRGVAKLRRLLPMPPCKPGRPP